MAKNNTAKTARAASSRNANNHKPRQAKRGAMPTVRSKKLEQALKSAVIEREARMDAVEDPQSDRVMTYLEEIDNRATRATADLHENIRILSDVLRPVMTSGFSMYENPADDRDPNLSTNEHNQLNTIESVEAATQFIRQLAANARL